ncbi:MAG: hypothetical protein IJE07_05460 [Clostridia bacterium]|nr:hypothetical protein [Clostridia bacterium]
MTELLNFCAENLPILVCFFAGIGFLILEVFMPGFGMPGITGCALEVIALVLTWFHHGAMATLGMLLIVLAVLAIAISTSLRSLSRGKMSKSKLILHETESNEAGYRATEDMEVFIGREGTTSTVLRPTGIADFDGVRMNVSSEGGYIPAGSKIRIISVEGQKILVRAI